MLIYCISGLGANELAFSNLGPFKYDRIDIPWRPILGNETISEYAKAIIDEYQMTNRDILVGLSFGGLLCQEIAVQIKTKYLILISSFRNFSDLQPFFQFGLNTGLYKFMPTLKMAWVNSLVANYLNSGTSESKLVIDKMLQQTDFKFMKWAIHQIAKFETKQINQSKVLNLVGNSDRIVKTWYSNQTKIIDGGSHFMVFDKADEVTEEINNFLTDI